MELRCKDGDLAVIVGEMPGCEANEPGTHATVADKPVVFATNPTGLGPHTVEAGDALNVPMAHGVAATRPVSLTKVPARQDTQESTVPPGDGL